jgi:uncharacterized protein DUF1876/uncharacterized protein DUF1918
VKGFVGDRIVIATNKLDHPARDGKIVESRHEDGSPPYLVEWSDTGTTALFFPGPDAHVEHLGTSEPARSVTPHVKSWRVELSLFELGDQTTAHAVLVADVSGVDATGTAHRRPGDTDVPEIGDEVAVGRALRRLSDRLLGLASQDIAAVEGRPVLLRN